MPSINILPQEVADLIAAGEVVERPASVVKELAENAIDAGATKIVIEIQRGGIDLIRVSDNGCGIDYSDVPKAFLPHATSKLKVGNDLEAISTLGFRGEALSSISAVSKVHILTKTKGSTNGTSFKIEGGEQTEYDVSGCPDGTTIVVRDIFYNVPARRKFLKKDVSEGNAVADVADKLSLSHPEISFRFIRDGKQLVLTPGDGKLLDAVHAVFGNEFASTLISAFGQLDSVKVSGLVCNPSACRGSRAMQFFFVNGRFIKSRALAASLENAYKNSIMVGKFPACVLFIELPPESVDVNVHPAKTEVRFLDERKVNSAVYYAAKSGISVGDTRPVFDVSKVTAPAVETGKQLNFKVNSTPLNSHSFAHYGSHLNHSEQKAAQFWMNESAKSFAAIQSENRFPVGIGIAADAKRGNSFIKDDDEPDLIGSISDYKKSPESLAPDPTDFTDLETNEQTNEIKFIGEAYNTYIIFEYKGKLCFIDKHAAHERIIFNRLKEMRGNEPAQALVAPVVVRLSKNEYDAVLKNENYFLRCGFEIDDFGSGSVAVRSRPMIIDDDDIEGVVAEIASKLLLGRQNGFDDTLDMILHTTACKAAIKAGNVNSSEELTDLAAQVVNDDNVRYCPHGRPVMLEMSRYELEKQFKRIQN